MGRWRLHDNDGSRWVTGKVDITQPAPGRWRLRYADGVQPFASSDPDSSRIDWADPGVHQNLAFPVQPDPMSGMHCWLQKVVVTKALADRPVRRCRGGHGASRARCSTSGWR